MVETARKNPIQIKTYSGRQQRPRKMPVRSKQQWKKFYAMYERGEITRQQLMEWTRGVRYKSLPKRANRKKTRA